MLPASARTIEDHGRQAALPHALQLFDEIGERRLSVGLRGHAEFYQLEPPPPPPKPPPPPNPPKPPPPPPPPPLQPPPPPPHPPPPNPKGIGIGRHPHPPHPRPRLASRFRIMNRTMKPMNSSAGVIWKIGCPVAVGSLGARVTAVSNEK